jgi:hypothetical protein
MQHNHNLSSVCLFWNHKLPQIISWWILITIVAFNMFGIRGVGVESVDQSVSLGIGPPFGTLEQILSCSSFFVWQLRYSSFKAPSLTRKRVCSLQWNHSLVRSLTPNNHTLPSHLRLYSIFVGSYYSQGLRWKYSNPPPHGEVSEDVEQYALNQHCNYRMRQK